MGALTDLWRSERGLLCLVIILAASVLAALGKTDFNGWSSFVMVVYGTYVAGKTLTSAVESRGRAPGKPDVVGIQVNNPPATEATTDAPQ